MSDEAGFSSKVLGGAVALALSVGAGVGGGVSSYVSGAEAEALRQMRDERDAARQEAIQTKLDELTKKVEAVDSKLEVASSDQFTRRDAKELRDEIMSMVRGVDERLRDHIREPWHTQAGAEHAETKRNVAKLEGRVRALEEGRK